MFKGVPEFASAALVAVALLALPAGATNVAQDAPSTICNEARERAIDGALRTLDRIEAWIPLVPPDEASYLSKEHDAAVRAQSTGRIEAVMAQPYFHAWRLHNSFEAARERLQFIKTLPIRGLSLHARIRLTIKALALAPGSLSNAEEAWSDYVRADGLKVLKADQVRDGTLGIGPLISRIGDYIACAADLIEDK
ncbi:MAG TPA: hypothetical protein VJN67_21160 [Stellaceae bacterium]|nr:hypothetical protein [Stellaceae bacterium]